MIQLKRLLYFIVLAPTVTFAQFIEETKPVTEELGTQDFLENAGNIVNFFLALIFIASIFGFIFSGIKYIIAGGDEGSLEEARRLRNAALIGSSLAVTAYVIIKLLQFLVK